MDHACQLLPVGDLEVGRKDPLWGRRVQSNLHLDVAGPADHSRARVLGISVDLVDAADSIVDKEAADEAPAIREGSALIYELSFRVLEVSNQHRHVNEVALPVEDKQVEEGVCLPRQQPTLHEAAQVKLAGTFCDSPKPQHVQDIIVVQWAEIQLVLEKLEAQEGAIKSIASEIESQGGIPVSVLWILDKANCYVYSARLLDNIRRLLLVVEPRQPLNPVRIAIRSIGLLGLGRTL